ncbi:hypothetical protein AGMMS49938_05510 [Fibrobacterales bacterium]|nr:hypothetical protein AGMMS49938_05510 [Fibrobacterales bacterium]
MRILFFICLFAFCVQGRSLNAVRKDALTVGVRKGQAEQEADFISQITQKMKISRYRIVEFGDAAGGESLLLSGKIDVIISGVNNSPNFERRFLVSAPYRREEIGVAVVEGSNIWTIADLEDKRIAFSGGSAVAEQAGKIWSKSKLEAVLSVENAVQRLLNGEVSGIFAERNILTQIAKNNSGKVWVLPNILAENEVVALFSFGSASLQEEFNKVVSVKAESEIDNSKFECQKTTQKRIDNIIFALDNLRKELEQLKRELK